MNAFRHASGCAVRVASGATEDGLSVTISDTGPGFDPEAPRDGLGLSGLRERVESIGGDFAVESRPGKGVSLIMNLPREALE